MDQLEKTVVGADPNAPLATKTKPEDWKKTLDELEKLRALPDSAPGGKTTSEIRSQDTGRAEVSRKVSAAVGP